MPQQQLWPRYVPPARPTRPSAMASSSCAAAVEDPIRLQLPPALDSASAKRSSGAVSAMHQLAFSNFAVGAVMPPRLHRSRIEQQPVRSGSRTAPLPPLTSNATGTTDTLPSLSVQPRVRRALSGLSLTSSAPSGRDLNTEGDGGRNAAFDIWQHIGGSDSDSADQSRPLTGSSQRSAYEDQNQHQQHAMPSTQPLLTWRCGLITAATACILLGVSALLWTFVYGQTAPPSSSAERPVRALYRLVIPPVLPAPCLPCECPCQSGPYVLLHHCKAYNEGIGSMLQHMKMALTIAQMAGWSFIADRSCFLEAHLKTDLSDFLGLYRARDCDACSLRNRPLHNVSVDFRIAENWRDAISGWVTCPVLTADDKQALSTGNASRISERWFLHRLLRDLFDTVRQTEPQRLSQLVFGFLPTDAMENLNGCFADLIHDRYEAAFRRQLAAGVRTPLPLNDSVFNIAVHFRWGDVSEKDVETLGGRGGFGLSSFRAAVASIMSLSVMVNRTRVWFLSEGAKSTFSSFLVSPQLDLNIITTFRLGEKNMEHHSRTFDDLDLLAHADILIGGQSSFFAFATQLAGRDAILIGNPTFVKFCDHSTGVYSSMLSLGAFNLTRFEQQLYALPKYARIVGGLPR